jgi:hypothetical protein
MESITYGGQCTWPLLRCVQFVSPLKIEHHGFDSRPLVSLGGSNITRGGLDLRMAHQRGDGEGVESGLS